MLRLPAQESVLTDRHRVQVVVLGFSIKRLCACLLAWQQQAHMLAGASRLLRRLLAVTVRAAFQEWRTVAQEQVHWHRVGSGAHSPDTQLLRKAAAAFQLEVDVAVRLTQLRCSKHGSHGCSRPPVHIFLSPALQVEHHLVNYLRSDDSGAAARGARAVLHWCNPALAAAFATWREAAQSQVSDRTNELKASKFLQLALALKALTGLKWAVQEAHVDRAAAGHRGGAVKKAVLRGWRQVTWYLQVWRRDRSHHIQHCAL